MSIVPPDYKQVKPTLPALAELACTYHDYGFNALPLDDPARTNTKHPSIKWRYGEKDYTAEHFTIRDITRHAERYQHGIIAITGIGNKRNIDFDNINDFSIIDEFLDLLGLPRDYPWVVFSGSGKGVQIWVLHAERDVVLAKNLYDFDARDKSRFDHVELRWRGNCCVLPPSKHPSGNLYRFRSGTFPDEPPAHVSYERIQAALDTIGILRHAENLGHHVPNQIEPLVKPAEAIQEARIRTTTGDTPYGLSALADECQDLATTPSGGRNTRLNLAAFRLAQLVAGGELTAATVERELLAAASSAKLDAREAEATFKSGFDAGMREPRSAPDFQVHHAPYDSDEPALDLDSLTLENAKKLIIELRQENLQLKAKDTWWNTIMANPKLKTVQKLIIRQRMEVEQYTKPGRKKDGKWWWRIDTEKDGNACGSDGTTISRNIPYLVAGGVLETWEEPIMLPNGYRTHLIWSRLTGAEKLPDQIIVPSNWGGKADRCLHCGGELKFKTRVLERQRIAVCKQCKTERVFQPEKVKSPLPVTPIFSDDEPAREAHADDLQVHHAPGESEETEDAEPPSMQNAAYRPESAECMLEKRSESSIPQWAIDAVRREQFFGLRE